MKRFWLYIVSLLFVCTSCEQAIEYKGEISKPQLVLQAEVGEGDSVISAFLSRSRFFLESETPYSPGKWAVTDAKVEIKRGDRPWQTMKYATLDQGYVLALDDKLKAQETIEIRASHPDYETVSAKQITPWNEGKFTVLDFNGMPNTVLQMKNLRMKNASYVEVTLVLPEYYPVKDSSITLSISVNCDYKYTYKSGNSTHSYLNSSTMIQSMDKLFATGDNEYSGGLYKSNYELFFAPGFEQPAKVLTIRIPYYDKGIKDGVLTIKTLEICCNAYTLDAYMYRKSMIDALNQYGGNGADIGNTISGLLGFEEPVQVYSNVKGGYGILAGCARSRVVKKNVNTYTYTY